MEIEDLKHYIGRQDIYALQLNNGGYIPVKKPITDADLQAHLKGEKTLGTYVIRPDNTVTYACIDIDGDANDLKPLLLLANVVYTLFPDCDRVLEFSGRRGYHIWLLFDEPEPAGFIKDMAETRLRKAGLRNIEVFPKQAYLSGKGYGNLIKMPGGLHKKGGWSKILKETPREE